MTRLIIALLLSCLLLVDISVASAQDQNTPSSSLWWSASEAGGVRVTLYFFWTRSCPHCKAARPDVEAIAKELPWVDVHSRDITADQEYAREYQELAELVGEPARSVPAFLFCGRLLTGYDNASGMGIHLREGLEQCRGSVIKSSEEPELRHNVAEPRPSTGYIPIIGDLDLSGWSLPMAAVALGALDSFNPCAFFVLLFLLSLMVNAASRLRMLVIGGMFVLVSGGMYFLFLAAWLNAFLLVGQLAWITCLAGVLAVTIGLINVKDFFWINKGPSLSISDQAKPGLFKRMRELAKEKRYAPLILGTFLLAVFANAYELLCTAGLPMVFTRMLTLRDLPTTSYYLYIALYCLIYILPMLAIVVGFAVTLGRRKLSEREGRILKLLSGLVMFELGLVLIIEPGLLSNIGTTLLLLGAAIGITVTVSRSSLP